MNSITVSAPGKLVFFGEHAVVYGYPCIVTAMDQRMKVTVEIIDKPEFQLNASDVNVTEYKKPLSEIGKGVIPKGALFVEMAVKNSLESRRVSPRGIKIITHSEFSSKLGFGSSSASAVCVVKALSELFKLELTNKEIFDLAYKTVMDIQKKGSGIDVAASIYGGTLYFVTGGKTIEPIYFPSINNSLPLLVAYSGIKADTVTLLNQVKKTFEEEKEKLKDIYESTGKIVERAKIAILKKDWKLAGELMNKNQVYLQQLGVSIPKLDAMIQAAEDSGAYGAKLSGAGGGDCIIALVPEQKRKAIEHAIEEVGGEIIHVQPNADGLRIEE